MEVARAVKTWQRSPGVSDLGCEVQECHFACILLIKAPHKTSLESGSSRGTPPLSMRLEGGEDLLGAIFGNRVPQAIAEAIAIPQLDYVPTWTYFPLNKVVMFTF